jgi:hypothetical protein
MERLRYTLFGIVFGVILGVSAAPTPSHTVAATAMEGTAWTPYHAAIPGEPREEPSPSF